MLPMPDSTAAAFARWPDVPACYGWLSLDRRGAWRLRNEPVTHAGLLAFMNANYGADSAGNWLVSNGPQRVFVALAYTPLVYRLQPDESLSAHTGARHAGAEAALMDEEGNILLVTADGVGLLDDRDLSDFVAQCSAPDGSPATDEALLRIMSGGSGVSWRGLPLEPVMRAEVPSRFGFEPDPKP